MSGRFPALSLLVVSCILSASVSAHAEDTKITYDDHVQAIFRQKCFSCHNPDKKSSGLDLTNYTNMMLGGASGESIVPGASARQPWRRPSGAPSTCPPWT